MNERIFEISGHLENFKDSMFGALDMEGAAYRPKPMNCPGHIAIYQSQQRSYRDLPIRMAEYGTVYRFEQSGELSGLTRVRGFTQDDAHLFCTADQLADELGKNRRDQAGYSATGYGSTASYGGGGQPISIALDEHL